MKSKYKKNKQEEAAIFEDTESYVIGGTSEKIEFRYILMRQIDKVRTSRSTEMRGGYEEERKIAMNGMVHDYNVYVPDTRQTYINSVKSLKMLLVTYFDKEFRDKYKLSFKDIKDKDKYESDEEYYNALVDVMDVVLEESLMLCMRVGLIGASQAIRDEVE